LSTSQISRAAHRAGRLPDHHAAGRAVGSARSRRFTTAQVAAIKLSQITALTVDQMGAFGTDQLQALGTAQIQGLTVTQLERAVRPAGRRAFTLHADGRAEERPDRRR
jgi:hypothetical protein